MKLLREWFGANREPMFQALTQSIESIVFNPLESENAELGKVYELVVLKSLRAILTGNNERTHLTKRISKMEVDELLEWRDGQVQKLMRHRPSDSDRILRINAWLLYHLNNLEIVDG